MPKQISVPDVQMLAMIAATFKPDYLRGSDGRAGWMPALPSQAPRHAPVGQGGVCASPIVSKGVQVVASERIEAQGLQALPSAEPDAQKRVRFGRRSH